MKTRKCSIAGCNGIVFAHNVCKYHYNRQYQKPISKREKKIPRILKDPVIHRGMSGIVQFESPFTSQPQMFKHIWKTRPCNSFLSAHPLDEYGINFYYNLFAHVLSKNKFPLFRLNEENIILLTPYEHTLLDKGTKAQRDKYSSNWWAVKEKAKQLWEKYHEIDPHCDPLPSLYQFM